jgi:hypothetical protein
MPDAGLACVASFAVSENTSVSRRGAALFPGESVEKSYQRLPKPKNCAWLFLYLSKFHKVLSAKHIPLYPFAPHSIPHKKMENRKRLTFAAIPLTLKKR